MNGVHFLLWSFYVLGLVAEGVVVWRLFDHYIGPWLERRAERVERRVSTHRDRDDPSYCWICKGRCRA